ncbi:MAG: hypothetical protein AUH20_01465 [Candidatus Rokubacteria bacterium 13_2_20CM_69_15_2]|nr:MAG: hypothetical protein AUH20_01465 [Candidatus Rokubacteria bacterium 13_2_20CM_69_15_2]
MRRVDAADLELLETPKRVEVLEQVAVVGRDHRRRAAEDDVAGEERLLLDEAAEGLAPLVRAEIWRCIARLKARGQSILLIDKDVAALTRIADAHYILEKGQIVWRGTSAELRAREDIQHRYLGV